MIKPPALPGAFLLPGPYMKIRKKTLLNLLLFGYMAVIFLVQWTAGGESRRATRELDGV